MASLAAHMDGDKSTLSKLTSFLRDAGDSVGELKFYPSLHTAVRNAVTFCKTARETEILGIVQALDNHRLKLCSRLDLKAFVLIFALFGISEPCWPQYRGLYLMAESLREADVQTQTTQRNTTVLDSLPLLPKKARIGSEILRDAMKYFCDANGNDGTRRWMGLLVLELLKACAGNTRLLVLGHQDQRHKLGRMVYDEQNELLRFVAGSILRLLCQSGISKDHFFPSELHAATHTAFPESQVDNSQWVEIYEGYLDDIDSQRMTEKNKFTPFSYVLKIDVDIYGDLSPAILVIVHDMLSIVVPEYISDQGLSVKEQYVDIPFTSIASVETIESCFEISSSPTTDYARYVVEIRLIERENRILYVNACAQSRSLVVLAFDNGQIAGALKSLLDLKIARKCALRNSQRSPLDLSLSRQSESYLEAICSSQHAVVSVSEEHLEGFPSVDNEARPLISTASEVEMLIATATRASEVLDLAPPWDFEVSLDRHDTGVACHNSVQTDVQHTRDLAVVSDTATARTIKLQNYHTQGFLKSSKVDCLETSTSQYSDGFNEDNIDHDPVRNEDGLRDSETSLASSDAGAMKQDYNLRESTLSHLSKTQIDKNVARIFDRLGTSAKAKDDSPRLVTVHSGNSRTSKERPVKVLTASEPQNSRTSKVRYRLLNRDGETGHPSAREIFKPLKSDKYPVASPHAEELPASRQRSKKPRFARSVPEVDKEAEKAPHAETSILPVDVDLYAIPKSPLGSMKTQSISKIKNDAVKKSIESACKSNHVSSKVRKATEKAVIISRVEAAATRSNNRSDKRSSIQPIKEVKGQHSVICVQQGEVETERHSKKGEEIPSRLQRPNKKQASSPVAAKTRRMIQKESSPNLIETTVKKRGTKEDKLARIARKAAPTALIHQSTRRTAAVKANQKIQGIEPSGIWEHPASDNGRLAQETTCGTSSTERQQKEANKLVAQDRLFLVKTEVSGIASLVSVNSPKQDPRSVELAASKQSEEKSKLSLLPSNIDQMEQVSTFVLPEHTVEVESPGLLPDTIMSPDKLADLIDIGTTPTQQQFSNAILLPEDVDNTDQHDMLGLPPDSELETVALIPQKSMRAGTAELTMPIYNSSRFRVSHSSTNIPDSPLKIDTGRLNAKTNRDHMSCDALVHEAIEHSRPCQKEVPKEYDLAEASGAQTSLAPPNEPPVLTNVLGTGQVSLALESSTPERKDSYVKQLLTNCAEDILAPKPRLGIPAKRCDVTEGAAYAQKNLRNSGINDKVLSSPRGDHISLKGQSNSMRDPDSPGPQLSPIMPRAILRNSKRKSVDITKGPAKRVKATTLGARISLDKLPSTVSNHRDEEVDVASTIDETVQRKVALTTFDPQGPLNQGVVSAPRHRAISSKVINGANTAAEKSLSTIKRKHTAEQYASELPDLPQRSKEMPTEKRRRTLLLVPPTEESDSKMCLHPGSLPPLALSQRLCSQGSRVEDNGSPIGMARQASTTSDINGDIFMQRLIGGQTMVSQNRGVCSHDRGANSEDEAGLPTNVGLPKSRLDLCQGLSDLAARRYNRPTSSNTKMQPSSPTAPSRMVDDIAPHRIRLDGNFVNVRTADIVTAVEPPDPFFGNKKGRPTSFVQKLRASTDPRIRVEVTQMDDTMPKLRATHNTPPHSDPDRTLVDVTHLSQPDDTTSAPSSQSSLKARSLKGHNLSSGLDDGVYRANLFREWRAALQPYQESTLNTLHEMSNRLVRHMLDKEAAVQDSVKEYDRGGSTLLDQLSKAHEADRQCYQDTVVRMKRNLSLRYRNLSTDLQEQVTRIERGRSTALQALWMAEQQEIEKEVVAAVNAYAG